MMLAAAFLVPVVLVPVALFVCEAVCSARAMPVAPAEPRVQDPRINAPGGRA